MPNTHRVAAIDIGSNSIHMILTEVDAADQIVVVKRMKAHTRISQYLNADGLLDLAVVPVMEEALLKMKALAQRHGATLRAMGTHAMREAKNINEIRMLLWDSCEIDIEIITGREEARLIHLGVQNGIDIRNQKALIVDIGGGSTEFYLGENAIEIFSDSIKLGCVALTTRFLPNNEIKTKDISALNGYIQSNINQTTALVQRMGLELCVGTSGTLKAIKSVALGLQSKPRPDSLHGLQLTAQEIELVKHKVLSMTSHDEVGTLPNLDKKRASVFYAGVLLLDTIFKQGNIQQCTISESSLREGIVIDTVTRQKNKIQSELYALALKYQVDSKIAQQRALLVVSLFKTVSCHLNLSPFWLKRLNVAAWLCECGKMIDPLNYSKHSEYLIAHSSMSELNAEDMLLVSLLARYHRKMPKKADEKLSFLDEAVRKEFLAVASLLRFVCQAEQLTKLEKINVTAKSDGLVLKMKSADFSNVSSVWDEFGKSLKLKAQFCCTQSLLS